LPTEAEWEYACRAGTTDAYAFGKTLAPEQANFGKKIDLKDLVRDRPAGERLRSRRPRPGEPRDNTPVDRPDDEMPRPLKHVGSFPANAWGLHDMHGNVWEWCSDFYSPAAYKDGEAADPTGPAKGTQRVLRGGAWNSPAADCTSAHRQPCGKSDTNVPSYGFRLVCEIR